MRDLFHPVCALVFLTSIYPSAAFPAVCNVPSGPHPSIQAAVDDVACTEVVLAAQTFEESVSVDRDLQIRGVSSATTLIEGRMVITGASTAVLIEDLTIDGSAPAVAGCFSEALVSEGGAGVQASAIIVLNGDGDGCLLFGDGFESGGTEEWSSTTGGL